MNVYVKVISIVFLLSCMICAEDGISEQTNDKNVQPQTGTTAGAGFSAGKIASVIHFDTAAFSNKIIFIETPNIGYKWKGGFRFEDVFLMDFYYNFGDMVMMDMLISGIPKLRVLSDPATGDSLFLNKDNLLIWTVKSRPFGVDFGNGRFRYDAGGGAKLFSSSAIFSTYNAGSGVVDTIENTIDRALVMFAVQSVSLKDRLVFNLYSSLARHGNRNGTGYTTCNIVPSGRLYWGRNRHWSLGAEYYLMNPVYFPFRTLQWALPPHMEFGNYGRKLVNWSFWGISYANRHFRMDLNIASYAFVVSPIFPVIGFGWNF